MGGVEDNGDMKRAVLGMVLGLLAALLAPAIADAPPAQAQASEEAAFVNALNATRAQNGLPALTVHGELTTLSRQWAETMSAKGQIFHANPISAGLNAPWLKLGENVGVGPSVDTLMDAFVASPGHFANIVDPEFTHVGVGVVWNGNVMYTTHRFMKMESAPPPAPPPPAPPAPAPPAPPPPAPPAPPPPAPPAPAPTPTDPPAASPTSTTPPDQPDEAPTPDTTAPAAEAETEAEAARSERIGIVLQTAHDVLP